MIEEEYPGKFEICYKTDVMSDEEWSSDLDKQILAITNGNSDVILYGSRDSFIEHYTGQFETYEYQQKLTLSGTKLREELKRILVLLKISVEDVSMQLRIIGLIIIPR